MVYFNKTKALINSLAIINKSLKDASPIIILIINFSKFYNYLIVALKSIKMKEFTIDYITIRLNYEVKKKNCLKIKI